MNDRRHKVIGLKRFEWLRRFLADESGPTAVEYAVMLALIITACAATIGTLGGHVQVAFETASKGW